MFVAQNIRKQIVEPYLPDEEYLFGTEVIRPSCAWCLAEQGIAAGEGSHGICKKHANSFLLQWREHRDRKSAARTQEYAFLA